MKNKGQCPPATVERVSGMTADTSSLGACDPTPRCALWRNAYIKSQEDRYQNIQSSATQTPADRRMDTLRELHVWNTMQQ